MQATHSARRISIGGAIRIAVIVLFLVWTLVPIALILLTSFKRRADIFTRVPRVIFQPTLVNYANDFVRANFAHYFLNSVIVAAFTTLVSMTIGTMAAYSLARRHIRGAGALTLAILACRMVPPIALVLPLYGLMQSVHLLNTYAAVIIAHSTINLPFVIWMMRGFFQEVPIELEECAQIDGCSSTGTFLRVALPLTAPGLAATTILCVLFSWNEFLFAVVLTDVSTRTLPVTVYGFIGAITVDWGGSSAAATVIMIPMIVMGLAVQKHLTRGLTLGAVKG
jgi:multiple sugar transport system permease protein